VGVDRGQGELAGQMQVGEFLTHAAQKYGLLLTPRRFLLLREITEFDAA
jgi:hypothetical protein